MPRSPDNGKAKVKTYTRIDPDLKEWGIKNGVNFSRLLEEKLHEEKQKKMSTTYLGYQVRQLADDTQLLQDWLKKHEGQALSVWGKTVVGSGSGYGTNPETYPWESLDGEPIEIKDFQGAGDRCEFWTEDEHFVVEVTELPKDKWGNTATYSGGLVLQEGYFEVGYSDTTEEQFNADYIDIDEIDAPGFIEWLKFNKPELIGEVSELVMCNGTPNEWTYYTTNKPHDSQEWTDALKAYCAI